MDEIELNFGGGGERDNQRPSSIDSNNHTLDRDSATSTSSTPGQQPQRKTEQDATTMVENIIADFAECETNHQQVGKSPEKGRIFSTSSGPQQQQMRLRRDATSTTSPTASAGQKVDSYEFSEETEERCEKISLFRKKRLADKKYEFSEDNSENIIPFNRMRTRSTNSLSTLSVNPSFTAINSSSPSHNYFDMMHHAHRGSPNYGFRSPCGSPIGNRCLRSPSGGQGYHPALSPSSSPAAAAAASGSGMFSPKHQYYFKRFNSLPPYVFSSPKRSAGDQLQEILPGNYQNPLMMPPPTQSLAVGGGESATTITNAPGVSGGSVDRSSEDEKLIFSKKVVRRFVEETDAASVITNEEGE